jgi:hypothetical protein
VVLTVGFAQDIKAREHQGVPINDMQKAINNGIEQYQAELNEKILFLEYLIDNFNDGRKKNFFCIAVNLLDLDDLNDIKEHIEKCDKTIPQKLWYRIYKSEVKAPTNIQLSFVQFAQVMVDVYDIAG